MKTFLAHAFILTLTCFILTANAGAYAFWENEESFIAEKEKRIEQKQNDKNAKPWDQKDIALPDEQDIVTLTNVPSIPPVIEYPDIGFYFSELNGFESTIWHGYTKDTLTQDFQTIKKIGILSPAQRNFIKRLLLSYAKHPKGFSSLDFLIYRLETLLEFGFNNEALNLLTTYQKQLLKPEERLHDIGVRIFVANNEYEAACLESLSHTPITDQQKQWRSHCSDPSQLNYKLSQHITLPELANSYKIALNPNEPLEERVNHFETGYKNHLFHSESLEQLLNEQKEFVRIAHATHFKSFYSKNNAHHRLKILDQIIQQQKNPALPIYAHFYSYLRSIKPNASFDAYIPSLYSYFSLLLDFDHAQMWKNTLAENTKNENNVDFKEKIKKICNFIHFSLANDKMIMLKHNAVLEGDMANKSSSKQTLVKGTVFETLKGFCSDQDDKTEDVFFEEAEQEIDTVPLLIKRFNKSAASQDKAQTGLLSFILWDINAKKTQNEADLQKNIKFILQNVSKSDLNNYVFAFSRDILYGDQSVLE